jgi:CCR4-NOT transcription complex subunit 2
MKLNQATHAAWNSVAVNANSQSQLGAGAFTNPSATTPAQPNGTHSNNPSQSQQQQSSQSQQTQHLNAPPGVPIPTNSYHTHAAGGVAGSAPVNSASGPTPYPSNGLLTGEQHSSNPNQARTMSANPHGQLHPQTPAQQILMSAADRWGLLGLLAMIKNAGTDSDQGLSSVGTDLGTMGLDMAYPG